MMGCKVIINEEVEGLSQPRDGFVQYRWVCSCGQADRRSWPNKWQAEDSGTLHERAAQPVIQ